ncbi:MAG TPA: hypothetical protein VNR87_11750 [Flavisolibacter sp.]|nr:hypothetical protein [Flavisolibacter sp.]
MGLSISPDFWILSVFKNNKERDLKIADYLDQIAEEATSLAKIWENVAKSLLTTGIADAEGNTVWIRLVERPEWTIYSKSIPRSRLEIFYDRIASILDNNQRGELDFVICKIGAILQKRKLTRDMIEEDLKRLKDARFFDKNNKIKDEISLNESIALLNREVAALCSYAKEYRTKIN